MHSHAEMIVPGGQKIKACDRHYKQVSSAVGMQQFKKTFFVSQRTGIFGFLVDPGFAMVV